MIAYTVGMVVGAITAVFPMIYLMNYDRSVAQILSKQAEFDITAFSPAVPQSLMTGITVIGVLVLLVCTTMVTITGLRKLKMSGPAAGPDNSHETSPEENEKDSPIDTEEETAI